MRADELSGIHVEPGEGAVVVSLRGDIDAALRDDASLAMAGALVDGRPILIDATEATFVDSAGVAFVLQMHLAASEAGIPVTLLDPGRVLVGVLETLELADAIAHERPDGSTAATPDRVA